MWQPHPSVKRVLIGDTRSEFRDLIRNVLITAPCTMYAPMSFMVKERQQMGSGGLPPGKVFTVAFSKMPENAHLQTPLESLKL